MQQIPVALVYKSCQTPRVPVTYQVWVQLISRMDQAEMGEIERIISHDPGLVTKIISVANSAYMGGRAEVSTLDEALFRLGTKEIIRIVGLLAFRDTTSEGLPLYNLDQHEYSKVCVYTALQMAFFHRSACLEEGEAYALGIISGLGRWFIQQALREQNVAMAPYIGPLMESHLWEEDTLRISHAEFASNAMQAFRLPRKLLEPLAYYLRPNRSPNPSASQMLANCTEQAIREYLPERNVAEPTLPADWYLTFTTQEKFDVFREKAAQILEAL